MLPCELYLVTTPDFDPDTELDGLCQILRRWSPAALRLDVSQPNRARAIVPAIRSMVQNAGTALILTDLPELAHELECDGVHLTRGSGLLDTARAALGDALQLGVACGDSRDEAMHAGEAGADYIAIDADATDLAQWWNQMVELPLVAETIESVDQARTMVAAGTDFLALTVSFTNADVTGAWMERVLDLAGESPA